MKLASPRRALLGAAFVALAPLLTLPALADDDVSAWRIFIADQATPTVTALDLDNPENRWTFELAGPARLYPSPSGQAVVAVQSDHDEVAFLKSGIELESHGEHADLHVSEPAMIEGVLEGPRPFHVITHDGIISINLDKGGYSAILEEAKLLDGHVEATQFAQNRAHHGFASPMGGYYVSSVASDAPVEGDGAPPRVGIQGFEADGSPIGTMQTCTDLHGEAFSGEYLLAGCKEGVVAVWNGGDAPEFAMLPYPEDFPEGHTGTLLGSSAMQVFLGNYGADSVVIIDPTSEPYFTRVDLPFRRVDFVMDRERMQFAYILTEDGTLHRLNVLSGEIEQSEEVVSAYSMDGHWRDPRPRLAMAGDRLVMTDPLDSSIRVFDSGTMEELDRIEVSGLPYNIIAIGGEGLDH